MFGRRIGASVLGVLLLGGGLSVIVPAAVVPEAQAAPGDMDDDGLGDALEHFFGTDPNNPDTDGDGVDDRAEVFGFLQWGRGSATDRDSDHDGIDDFHDDDDGDGVTNGDERRRGTNPFVADSDYDGLSDGEELSLGTDPLLRDSDGDGVRDGDEDADADGLTLAAELAGGTDATASDTDGDGLPDGLERGLCTDPLRTDSDGDGRPDATDDALCLARTTDAVPDWKLFQRGPAGRASIVVPVRYRVAEPTRLELAIVAEATGLPLAGFGYDDHAQLLAAATSPAGATVVVELAGVPQGGNYDLVARLVDPDGTVLLTDLARHLAVGDVFLAAGQSNMSGQHGFFEPPTNYETPDPLVHAFGNDHRWKLATEPVDDPTDSVDDVGIDGFARSSPMLRFAKEVVARTGVPIAVIPATAGGTALLPPLDGHPDPNRWVRDPADPAARGTLYGVAISRVLAQGYTNPIRGVLWYQGESDTGRGTDAYRDGLRELVADLRADLASPGLFFASCQLARYALNLGETVQQDWLDIREAQRQYAGGDPASTLVGTLDVPIDGGGHLVPAGSREVGRRLGNAVLRGSYHVRADVTPLLKRTRLARAGRRIQLSYDASVTGGEPAAFRVVDGTALVPVTLVQARGRRVTLELARAVSPAALVSYGVGGAATTRWLVGLHGQGSVLAFAGVGVEANLIARPPRFDIVRARRSVSRPEAGGRARGHAGTRVAAAAPGAR